MPPRESELREAWYRPKGHGVRDYIALLHPPYSLWHLSYVILGASLAPKIHIDRLAMTLIAFFLGLVVAGHFLDELHGHPLGTKIPDAHLLAVALTSLSIAGMIGLWGLKVIGWGLLPFIAFSLFIVFAYNLESFGGLFHNMFWFGASWGSLPALVGYYANAVSITPVAILVALACYLLSVTQRKLSLPVRRIRRKAERVDGEIRWKDGTTEKITWESLISAPEAGLKWLSLTVPMLALTLLIFRLS